MKVAFGMLLIWTIGVRSAAGQCVAMPLADYRQAAVAFVGTVKRIEPVPAGQIVSFDVSRVYKGKVSRHVAVYERIDEKVVVSEGVTLELETSCLVLPHTQSREEMERFGLSGVGAPLALAGCDAWPTEARAYLKDILGSAPGYPPR